MTELQFFFASFIFYLICIPLISRQVDRPSGRFWKKNFLVGAIVNLAVYGFVSLLFFWEATTVKPWVDLQQLILLQFNAVPLIVLVGFIAQLFHPHRGYSVEGSADLKL